MCSDCGKASTDQSAAAPAAAPAAATSSSDDHPAPDDTDRSAHIQFRNDFPVPLKLVYLAHYFNHPLPKEVAYWHDLESGQTTTSSLEVEYKTGPFTPWDSWDLQIQFMDGKYYGVWNKDCFLTEEDDIEHGVLTYGIKDGYKFAINLKSSSCTAELTWPLPSVEKKPFNSFVFVQVTNNFKKPATIIVTHQCPQNYIDSNIYTSTFEPNTKPGETTSIWIVHFVSGYPNTNVDKWQCNVTLDDGTYYKIDPIELGMQLTTDHCGKIWKMEVDTEAFHLWPGRKIWDEAWV